MVDFNMLLSPRHQADLTDYKSKVAECMARTDANMAGYAVHALHNANNPRDRYGDQIHSYEQSYASALHFVVLPELIRRLSGGTPPQKCPVCGAWIDWNVALMQAKDAES
jgi:hypothetical protein